MGIQLDKLSVGAHSISIQNFSEEHKRDVECCLSTVFSKQFGPNKNFPFHIRLEEERSFVEIGDREVVLERSSELKRLERIARFYKHVGKLAETKMDPKDQAVIARVTKESVQAIHDANVPGTNGRILAGIRIADDTLSFTRSVLSAIPVIGAEDPIVRHLGYYAAMIWAFFSFQELDQGIVSYTRSKRIGDAEGQRRAETAVVSGALCSVGSLAYLTGRICESLSESAGAVSAFGAANLLFGLGSILGAGASFLGAWRCSSFNDRLAEYLDHPKLTESEKLRGALHFLKDSISVTAEEKRDLLEQVEKDHPHLNREEKEKLLLQKLKDLTEVKVKYMKRRSSSRSLYLILTKVDAILAKLENSATKKEGMVEAILLLRDVQEENKIKMSLYILGLVASLIGLAALAAATFFTAGVFPFVLYGISGIIYLATTIYQNAGTFLKSEDDSRAIELHPI